MRPGATTEMPEPAKPPQRSRWPSAFSKAAFTRSDEMATSDGSSRIRSFDGLPMGTIIGVLRPGGPMTTNCLEALSIWNAPGCADAAPTDHQNIATTITALSSTAGLEAIGNTAWKLPHMAKPSAYFLAPPDLEELPAAGEAAGFEAAGAGVAGAAAAGAAGVELELDESFLAASV